MKTNIVNASIKDSNQLLNKLSFKPGQIIRTQVVKLENSQVQLQYGSYLLTAKTKVSLKTGQRLKLLVESTGDSQIKLKIINENINQKQLDVNRSGINSQGKPDIIVQQLLKFNLPVSQETLEEINRLINKYKLSEDLTQLVIWLKTVGIKVDSDKDIQVLKALQRFFEGELSGNEETQFFEFLNQTENNTLSGFNISGWSFGSHYIYFLTSGSKSKGVQKEDSNIIIKIKSPTFEDIWFKINLVNNELGVNAICNSNQYKDILTREVGLLCKTLQAAGYQITTIPIDVNHLIKTVFDIISSTNQEILNINLKV